jgi:hypothetical protein
LGGVFLRLRSELEFSLDGSPADFAIELLLAAGIPVRDFDYLNPHPGLPLDPDAHIPKSFIEQTYTLMHEAQLPKNWFELERLRKRVRLLVTCMRLDAGKMKRMSLIVTIKRLSLYHQIHI